MTEEGVKFVLYQKWARKKLTKYGVNELCDPTKMLTVFPGTPEGLNEAIEAAERPNAVLVKLGENYTQAIRLIEYVEAKIKAGKFVPLFKPTNRIPRS